MSFTKSLVDFSKTHALSKITEDYINANPALKPCIEAWPVPHSFQHIISKRKSSIYNRSLLVTVLREQNAGASKSTLENIESLGSGNTFTVTTGHQLNIFTGPLYFIYKIITTIKLAQMLNEKYRDCHFVPVYWMNGEDHDIEEINHTYLYGKRIEWKTDQKGATGRMNCKGMPDLLNELENLLDKNDLTPKLLVLLREAYAEKNILSNATRAVVTELFGKYGLVILDADEARLKKEFIPIINDDLFNHSAEKKVHETSSELEKQYSIQVNPRTINLFYLDGIRERIVKDGAVWKALNTEVEWTEETLKQEVESHSERFSPNVVLRPLYQEFILPNVAMIGGPSEVAYWLEYKKMFDHYEVNFPVLMLRQCTLLVDKASAARWKKSGFENNEWFKSGDELSKEYVLHNSEDITNTKEEQQIAIAFDDLVKKVSAIDVTLKPTAEAEKKRTLNALQTLNEKLLRAQKRKHETGINQITKLKEKFFPEGMLQERHDNFIPFYLKQGSSFFDDLLANCNPFEKNFVVLTEE